MTNVGDNVSQGFDDTKDAKYRFIYFKLPIRQTQFHWVFTDSSAFLSGNLTLHVKNDGRIEEITVFDNGKIMEGWRVIGEKDKPVKGTYFGFASGNKFLTSMHDEVEIVLKAPLDLEGIGPDNKGTLESGEYRTQSRFTIFAHNNDWAFTGDTKCNPMWDVIVTESIGWWNKK